MRLASAIVLVLVAALSSAYTLVPDARHALSLFASEFAEGFAQGIAAAAGRAYSLRRYSAESPDQASGAFATLVGASASPSFHGDLPTIDLKGYGEVQNLREALAQDDSGRLRKHVEAFSAEDDVPARRARMEVLLFEWAGAGDVDPQSRGPHIDGRKLATLEAFLAEDFRQQGSPDPRPNGAAELHKAFDILKNAMYGQLMRQTHLLPYFEAPDLVLDDGEVRFDFSNTTKILQERFHDDPARGVIDLLEFERVAGEQLVVLGFDPYGLLRDWLVKAGDDPSVQAALADFGWDGVRPNGAGTAASEIVFDRDGAASLIAGSGGDWLLGGDGDDILQAGPGDDFLYGGAGNNTYRFDIGQGQNTLVELYGDRTQSILELGPGIRASDLDIRAEDHALILAHRNGHDSITIKHWFGAPNPEHHRLHAVRLADGDTIHHYK